MLGKILAVILICFLGWFVGYFQAWHNSLSRQYASEEFVVDLGTHLVKRISGSGCEDANLVRELSGHVNNQLGFLAKTEFLMSQSITVALSNPITWFDMTVSTPKTLTVEELRKKAAVAGIDVTTVANR
jgi:hypothetical protein